jgi:hypothetical protein
MAADLNVPPTAACSFDVERHLYTVDGIIVPSVTQVLEEEKFVDFSMIPSETLDQAKARGTYVHTVLHYYLEGDFDLADVAEPFRGYVDSALEYIARAKKQPLRNADGQPMAVEYRFWHLRRMYGGTIDWLGWDDDEVLAIDDWKTGEPTDVAAALQSAAYEAGIREGHTIDRHGHLVGPLYPNYRKPIRRRAVKLYRDGRPGRPEPTPTRATSRNFSTRSPVCISVAIVAGIPEGDFDGSVRCLRTTVRRTAAAARPHGARRLRRALGGAAPPCSPRSSGSCPRRS